MFSTVLGFPEVMNHSSISDFCDGGHRFFSRVGVTMNLKRFDVFLDNKLSIKRLYLFCCLFAIFFVENQG